MSFGNMLVVAAVAAAVPLLPGSLPRLAVPGPVLEIVTGVVLGPAVLGVLHADTTVRAVSVLGLAFLLFLAGLEIDVQQFRGPAGRRPLGGLGITVVLGIAAGFGLFAAGLARNPLLVGIALMATSLGLVVPVLKDAGGCRAACRSAHDRRSVGRGGDRGRAAVAVLQRPRRRAGRPRGDQTTAAALAAARVVF